MKYDLFEINDGNHKLKYRFGYVNMYIYIQAMQEQNYIEQK